MHNKIHKNKCSESRNIETRILVFRFNKGVKTADFNAGSKAVNDIVQIALSSGVKPFYVDKKLESSKTNVIFRKITNSFHSLFAWVHMLLALNGNDSVLLQSPFKTNDFFRNFFQYLVNRRSSVITLLHDINCLRNICTIKEDKELRIMIKSSKIIIVHNDAMMKWMISQGVDKKRLVNLGLFDYISTSGYAANCSEGVIIAGNLSREKSPYVYELDKSDCEYELYGVGYKDTKAPNCHYHGAVDADKLSETMDGKWGLVWDGTSIDTCAGDTGDYLRYNNPHKMSLYIASGLPIIIWSEAAQADFVKKYQIGICVKSLRNLQSILDLVTEVEYDRYKQNVMALSHKVREGYFFNEALREANQRLRG